MPEAGEHHVARITNHENDLRVWENAPHQPEANESYGQKLVTG